MTPASPGHAVVSPAYSTSQRTPATADESNVPESIYGDELSAEQNDGIVIESQ